MKWNRKRKALLIVIVVYCILWVITGIWGVADVDREFDREFAFGYADFSEGTPAVAIQRIDKMANVRDLMDPANKLPSNSRFFRFRTRGIAVAPFVVVDQVATVFASLGGFGGRRVNIWFFGFTKWWLVKGYWSV